MQESDHCYRGIGDGCHGTPFLSLELPADLADQRPCERRGPIVKRLELGKQQSRFFLRFHAGPPLMSAVAGTLAIRRGLRSTAAAAGTLPSCTSRIHNNRRAWA